MKTTSIYITKHELATMLGMTKRGVEELMRARKIPFLAIGHRTVRFHWPAVERALSKYECKPVQ